MEVLKCKFRDPISFLTHFFGFIVSIPIMVILIMQGYKINTYYSLSLGIFGISLMLLYGASALYHAIKSTPDKILLLRKIDHAMIFILIAGTYTPICKIILEDSYGDVLLNLIYVIMVIGILISVFFINAPRKLTTSIYLIMGWLSLSAFVPLMRRIPPFGIVFLVTGGLMYTIGAIIYGKKLEIFNFRNFGFHEVFHIFVLLGSMFHIIFMFNYIL